MHLGRDIMASPCGSDRNSALTREKVECIHLPFLGHIKSVVNYLACPSCREGALAMPCPILLGGHFRGSRMPLCLYWGLQSHHL